MCTGADGERPDTLVILTVCGIIRSRENDRPDTSTGPISGGYRPVLLAYLFDSQATGTAGPQSDYVVALLVHNPSLDLQACLAHEIGAILGMDQVDVVFLNWVPVELAYAVIAQGRLLYEWSVAERVEFEAKVLGMYADYLPILRRQQEEILKGEGYEAGIQRYREALRQTERTLAEIRAAADKAAG
ncbi:MAG: nucleotidyltransferase domain-containing protein [Candidatus Bathyarchaeia archaeon]